MKSNPNPDCDKDCAFEISDRYGTLMAIRLVQDKNGDFHQYDPNTDYWRMSCLTCNKKWAASKKRSDKEPEFEEITKK